MTQINKKISELMAKQAITATDIQKLTGLNRNTIYSIIAGNSKNPSAHNLQLIAKALNVSLSSFLIDEPTDFLDNLNQVQIDCYKKSTTSVIDYLLKKETKISLNRLTSIIKEVYQYSMNSQPPKIDEQFVAWIIDKQG